MKSSNFPLLRSLGLLALILAGAADLSGAPKIGVLLKGRSPFWGSMEKGALAAGAKQGVEIVCKAPQTESDVSVQIQLLNSMAAQGFDAIVIAPANKDALAAPVAALAAKGTKIVVLESPLAGDNWPVFVATDHAIAGAAAGALLASLVSDGDEVAFLNHSQTNSSTLAREKSALAGFRELRPKSPVRADIYASAEAGTEMEKARLVLARYPTSKAIFVSSSATTLMMLKALEEKKLAGAIKLIGFGFNLNPEVAAAIAGGRMHGWIAWQPHELGAHAVDAALRLVKGETVPKVVNADFVVVTAANLQEPQVQALMGR